SGRTTDIRDMKDLHSILWDIFAPHDMTYFSLPVYRHFNRGAYHARTVRHEWDVKLLREDLAASLIRSEVQVNPEGPQEQRERIEQLLFRLDDVFCELDQSNLTVYALTWARAAEYAEQLTQKYAKAKSADQPCFYLLSANRGDIDVE